MSADETMKLPGRMIYGCAWKKERTAGLVESAIRAGFRSIDVAAQRKHYNQPGVGEALSKVLADPSLGVQRKDLFLQTKFTSLDGQDRNGPLPYDAGASLQDQVRQSFETSLHELNTDYIDSLLLHSPERTVPKTVEALLALKPFVDSGKLHHIGISNIYNVHALEAVDDEMRKHGLFLKFVQNRFYDQSGYDVELRDYCRQQDIVYQSFWTLTANPHVLSSGKLQAAAKRLQITPEQCMYQFCLQEGITPLNGTTNEERMKLGVAVQNNRVGLLTDKEMQSVRSLMY